MNFKPSTILDIDEIFQFYDLAVAYQKTKFNKQWQGFDRDLVAKEISENRQWKVVIDDETACVFAITFEDKSIWKEKNVDKAVYFSNHLPELKDVRSSLRDQMAVLMQWLAQHITVSLENAFEECWDKYRQDALQNLQRDKAERQASK